MMYPDVLEYHNLAHILERVEIVHERFVSHMTEFLNALSQNACRLEGERILSLLDKFLNPLFQEEEACMTEVQFPAITEHCQDHQRFLKQLTTIRRRLQSRDSACHDLTGAIADWLTDHIHVQDQGFLSYLKMKMLQSTLPTAHGDSFGASGKKRK